MKKITQITLVALMMLSACSSQSTNQKNENSSKNESSQQTVQMTTEYPLTFDVQDINGEVHQVVITEEPKRVVTTSVSSTEMLLELGLKEKIVGIMKPDNTIEGKFAKDFSELNELGDKKTMSKEVVIAATPDIMIGRAALFSGKGLPTLQEASTIGINVVPQLASVDLANPTLETSLQDFMTYAKIFNLTSKAEEISKPLQQKITQTDQFIKSLEPKTQKVLAMTNFNGETFGSFNIHSGVPGDIMNRLHLEGYTSKKGAALTLENLISMNPDIIIYVTATRNAKNDEDAINKLMSNEGLKSIPAIQNKKIIEIGYDDLMDFGLRSIDTYEKLAHLIYGN